MMIEQWHKGYYFSVGMEAYFVSQLIGLAPADSCNQAKGIDQIAPTIFTAGSWSNSSQMSLFESSMYPMASSERDPLTPAYFMAGVYYGIFEEDVTTEVLKCFNQSEELTNSLYDCH